VPVTATVKVAVCPIATSALAGWDVMDGATDAPFPFGVIAPVTPAHPEWSKLPNRTKKRSNPDL